MERRIDLMRIKSKRTLSILISLAMITLFVALYLALNSNLFAVSAVSPPKITSASATTLNAGGTFQFTATPTSLPASPTNLWSLTGQPGGVTVEANSGILSVATSVPASIYTFNVTVTNSAGSATQAFTLTVNSVSTSPGTTSSYGSGGTSSPSVYVYTVRFNAKGGSAVESQYIIPGGKVKEPEDPTKKDFVFGGWYLESKFETEYDFDLAVTSDLILYAKWTDGKETPDPDDVGAVETPFDDVSGSDWFLDAVAFVNEKGLMIGMGDGLFGPEISVSRAMIVTILYRLAGAPDVSDLPNPFDDVEEGQWYTDAVRWGASQDIVLGYDDGSFGPTNPVTKEQLAALIYRTQQADGKIPNDILMDREWPDWDEISDWAKNPVNVLTIQGLFRDIPGVNFNPQAPATRAETASILYRYLTSIG